MLKKHLLSGQSEQIPIPLRAQRIELPDHKFDQLAADAFSLKFIRYDKRTHLKQIIAEITNGNTAANPVSG